MNTTQTATDLNKLNADIISAKADLGKMSCESEIARHLLITERLLTVVEALDERTRQLESQLKRLTGDGK